MKFQDLGLSEPLLRAIGEKGYTDPTPIQQQAILPVLEGRDLQGCAQTGTGKTAAFTLPILQLLAAEPAAKGRREIRALVITPTRELAIQIDECCRDYARYLSIRHCVIFGGVNQRPQVDALQRGVDLLVATPGRLLDLIGQGYISLDKIRFFVLDEADRMLDMGFIHDIRRILPLLPARRQTLFFSATMPSDIAELAAKILHDPVLVTVTPPASVVETIAQKVYFAEKAEKSQLLIDLLSASDAQQVLVFSRTKHGADKLAKILNRAGIQSCAIHGNKSQNARVKAMNDFKSGECRVMIATDIAARGIDIDQLPLVINYELPEVPETYVHRIGRTGRAGYEGTAWSFCSEDEYPYLKDIQKLTGLVIPVEGAVPEFAARQSAAPARKPAQKAAQKPARSAEPKPAPRRARNAEPKPSRNPEQKPPQESAEPSARPSRSRRRRGTRPAPGTPIQQANKPAADTARKPERKQGSGNAPKPAGNNSAAKTAPEGAPKSSSARHRKRRPAGGAKPGQGQAAKPAAESAPRKSWWKMW
ncbi:MAG: DEAD/DEAH box helicase [Alistipes sp.]|nr:DEAD/DEAH box helicase [Alistipes sp.]